MALTDDYKVAARVLTGRPMAPRRDRFGNTDWGEIESALDEAGTNPAFQNALQAAIDEVTLNIDVEMSALHGFAVFKRAEELELNPDRYRDLRAAGRRQCNKIASMLGIRVFRDIFAPGDSSGPLRMG